MPTIDERWRTAFAALIEYRNQHGDLNPVALYRTADGFTLGKWVHDQRALHRKGRLRPDRQRTLTDAGFDFNPPPRPTGPRDGDDQIWATHLDRLRTYIAEHGHAHVPQRYIAPDGHALGLWLQTNRTHYYRGTLTPQRELALRGVGVELDPEKVQRNGNASPDRYRTYYLQRLPVLARFEAAAADGVDLATLSTWSTVPAQYADLPKALLRWRRQHAAGNLPAPIVDRMRELGVDWGATTDQAASHRRKDLSFERFITELDAFVAEHGHPRVPRRYIPPSGYRLYNGLRERKRQAAAGTLRPGDRARLLALGVDLPDPTP